LTEVYTVLNVQPETIQTVPSHSRESATQYRAEVMAAKIRHKAGEYAIKQLTAPMGISAPTLRGILQADKHRSNGKIRKEANNDG
jgi:hypothetical protein